MEPIFFESPAAWRAWLEAHHETETEVWVGFYKAHLNPTLTWKTTVPEALCFGWIDGISKRIDDDRHKQRFTPRRPTSAWSAVNAQLIEELDAAGKLMPAGRAAWERRDKTQIPYSIANRPDHLPPEWDERLRQDAVAAAYWDACPPSYRKQQAFWITDAVREATRERRFASLLDACREERRMT